MSARYPAPSTENGTREPTKRWSEICPSRLSARALLHAARLEGVACPVTRARPAKGCFSKRAKMRSARQRMFRECGALSSSGFTDLRGRVRVRGVGFWDEVHGQTGVAPNGIELHPVLSFDGHSRQV